MKKMILVLSLAATSLLFAQSNVEKLVDAIALSDSIEAKKLINQINWRILNDGEKVRLQKKAAQIVEDLQTKLSVRNNSSDLANALIGGSLFCTGVGMLTRLLIKESTQYTLVEPLAGSSGSSVKVEEMKTFSDKSRNEKLAVFGKASGFAGVGVLGTAL